MLTEVTLNGSPFFFLMLWPLQDFDGCIAAIGAQSRWRERYCCRILQVYLHPIVSFKRGPSLSVTAVGNFLVDIAFQSIYLGIRSRAKCKSHTVSLVIVMNRPRNANYNAGTARSRQGKFSSKANTLRGTNIHFPQRFVPTRGFSTLFLQQTPLRSLRFYSTVCWLRATSMRLCTLSYRWETSTGPANGNGGKQDAIAQAIAMAQKTAAEQSSQQNPVSRDPIAEALAMARQVAAGQQQ